MNSASSDKKSHNGNIVIPFNLNAMIRPSITISPFTYAALDSICFGESSSFDVEKAGNLLATYLERDYLFTRSGRDGLDLILSELRLAETDVVTILPSLGNFYVSSCVTKTIEKHCRWSMRLEAETKVALVIHEWGIPHPQIDKICQLGVPVIEDCAYALASTCNGNRVGLKGQYAVYSLPKFFAINFGGIVCGMQNQGKSIADMEESYLLRGINSSGAVEGIAATRISNWLQLKKLFSTIEISPYFELSRGVIPGVFMFSVPSNIDADLVKLEYQKHNVECSVYYGSQAVYIPCHQNLGLGSMEYLFRIFESFISR